MDYKLTNSDYVKILNYYNVHIPNNKNTLKKKAEDILASKLCSCIKKVSPNNEAKAIGVCSRTIFNRKGLKRGKFTCREKKTVNVTKINKKMQSIGNKTLKNKKKI